MYSVQRESLIDHRGCDGRPALCARSQVRSDGKRTAQCDHRVGDFDRCTHQRSLAGKAEVCRMVAIFGAMAIVMNVVAPIHLQPNWIVPMNIACGVLCAACVVRNWE